VSQSLQALSVAAPSRPSVFGTFIIPPVIIAAFDLQTTDCVPIVPSSS
jgi:hypothetical protein